MFGIAQAAFHKQANGSLISYQGRTVGSSLLCQEFVDAGGNPLPHPPVNEKGLIDDNGYRKPAFGVVRQIYHSLRPFR